MDYTNYQNISVAPRDFLNSETSPASVRTVEPNRSESESTEQRLYGAYRNTDRAVRELTPDSTPDAPLIYPLADGFNPEIAEELNSETAPPMTDMQQEVPPMRTRQTITDQRNQPQTGTMQDRTSAMPGNTNRMQNMPMSGDTNRMQNMPMSGNTGRTESVPMPSFTTAARTRNAVQSELYTPIGDKLPPQPMRAMNPAARPFSYTPRRDATSISYQNVPENSDRFGMYYTSSQTYPDLTTSYQRNSENNLYLPTRTVPYYNMPSESYESMNDFEEAERDLENLKQLYPAVWRVVQGEIMEECDKLEYEGSCMFDEYPDRVTIDRIIDRIYAKVKDNDQFKNYDTPEPAVSVNQIIYNPCPRCNWAEDFIRIMFLNEMSNRRRRYRSRRHWFY